MALLPERSYIDMALGFANHSRFQTVTEAQSIFWEVSGIDFDAVGPQDQWLKLIQREQKMVRSVLSNIADNPDLPPDMEDTINKKLVSNIVVKAKISGGRLQLHYEVVGILGAAPLGVAFLLHNDMAGRLRQCGHCARFFLAEGNQNRARFCRGECAKQNKAAKNRERQRRHYERQKKQRK